jgi:hypothetical protein
MDTTNELSPNERLEVHREIIRRSLHEIATEVETALREVGLNYPVFLTVPHSGDPIATIATPLDPSNDDWLKMSAIACRVVGRRLGIRLIDNALPCAMANAAMSAADLTAD